MPFNLLIFPLVGGYYILTRFEYLKYIQYRLESQRILFNSAFAGIILLSACLLLRSIASWCCPSLITTLGSYLPVKAEKKELIFTTQYLTVYASYMADGSIANQNELKTDLVIKAEKVISVSYFDMNIYKRFNPDEE